MKKFLFLLILAVTLSLSASSISSYGDDDGNSMSTLDASISVGFGMDNGHQYVNLGLPSGTKWAVCNVGASSPGEIGNLFAWGETNTKSDFSWETYKYGKSPNTLTKYCSTPFSGLNEFWDDKIELDITDDAARKHWGGSWRMPSKKQFEELVKYTQKDWTTHNNVEGIIFIGKSGGSIFLPCTSSTCAECATYWTRTLDEESTHCAFSLSWDYLEIKLGIDRRYRGYAVRPVRL